MNSNSTEAFERYRERVTEALERYRERVRAGEVATVRLSPREKWQAKNTRTTAIAAMCWDCMGGDRAAIRACTSGPGSEAECPLWSWRPYQ